MVVEARGLRASSSGTGAGAGTAVAAGCRNGSGWVAGAGADCGQGIGPVEELVLYEAIDHNYDPVILQCQYGSVAVPIYDISLLGIKRRLRLKSALGSNKLQD